MPRNTLDKKVDFDLVGVARYGRFKDKDSILVALHEAARAKMITAVEIALDPHRWAGKSVRELAKTYAAETFTFYKKNRNLLVAALAMGGREIYERAAATIHHVAACFGRTVSELAGRECDADFSLRIDQKFRT